ncbi:MAG: pseudaminic acid biosynthesis-associated methylase [Rhodospirillales bacterium]|nr:pseudaminic acid biosynthesis-associated methylase [Rhodospirillales bacterium]
MAADQQYKTEQEEFWAGSFGDDYVDRSADPSFIPPRLYMFSEILKRTSGIKSFMEFGPNIGLNLLALRQLMPQADLYGIEINEKAVEKLREAGLDGVEHGSFLESTYVNHADFVFTSGVLIHINPDMLPAAYDALYRASTRYICVSEYYNPVPVEMDYRGNSERLFKRDFAGEIMDKYPDVKLVDYGFIYQRDPNFAQDDTNWFLLEKR